MSTHWLWFTVPITLISIAIIFTLVVQLIETNRKPDLASLPLVSDQTMVLDTSGTLLLHVEGPRFTWQFGGLEYQLKYLDTNQEIDIDIVLFRLSSSGTSKSRLSVGRFEITHGGDYRLLIKGIDSEAMTAEHRIVITEDNRLIVVPMIIGIVCSGFCLFASVGLNIALLIMTRVS